jgi:hypothetical protein
MRRVEMPGIVVSAPSALGRLYFRVLHLQRKQNLKPQSRVCCQRMTGYTGAINFAAKRAK